MFSFPLKRISLLFLAVFLPSICLAGQYTPLEDGTSTANTDTINRSLNDLYNTKLDLRPQDILPIVANIYSLGNTNYKWKNIFVDSATINAIYFIDGTTQTTAATSAVIYSLPNTSWISTTAVDISTNTATANQTCISFPDMTSKCVIENTAATSLYRRFIVTETAEFKSGTENSGLLSPYVETANTWYFLYAVKSQIDATKFVIVGTTFTPTPDNYTTLDSTFGANSWVFLETIADGNGASANKGILKYYQSKNFTEFANTGSGFNSGTTFQGKLIATNAGATSLTYTYSSGVGATNIPSNLIAIHWAGSIGSTAGSPARIFRDSGGVIEFGRFEPSTGRGVYSWTSASAFGAMITVNTADTPGLDLSIVGFYDSGIH